jgi:hypothetical protein
MPTLQQTKPGTRRLSEVARHVVPPAGIEATGWPSVERTCREKLGIVFDGWQQGAGRLILSKRADGKLAVMVGGVGMSLPRQVGKTYLLAGLIFGLCVNTPGLLIIWSAHHARTHEETFLSMQGFASRSKVRPYIGQVFKGSGDEEIRFHNGSRILFGARERGFGRGIPGVDVLMMDEAQILSGKALDNMLATMNTSRFGLALYVGTPPKPEDNSEAFTQMRVEALSGESTEQLWIECGADENADIDDQRQWAKANPSFPHRTPPESVMRLRKKLTPDSFRREALGIWPSPDLIVFDLARWSSPPLLDRSVEAPARVSVVIDVSPDRRWSSIGVAGEVGGKTLLMCLRMPGTDGVVPKLAALIAERDVVDVAITPDQAKAVVPALNQAGIDFKALTRGDMGASCAAIQEAIKAQVVVHVGQPELDAAIANARTRYVGEVEQWDRRDPGVDISPLVACSGSFYRWGLLDIPLPIIY